MGDFMFFLLLCAIAVAIYFWWKSSQTTQKSVAGSTTTTHRAQLAEDIKSTQTSRVSDAIEILDELSGISNNHRQYCELIGTSMKEGGVIAPYSQRPVAYYNVRCYKIEYKGGQEVETLVANESSFDPFYFTDDSCETPIYVDLASFGTNVILVNSTNHIEGPNSEFAQAVGKKISAATKGGATSLAMVENLREKFGNLLGNFSDAVDRVLLPGGAPSFAAVPALAGADGSVIGANMLYAKAPHGAGGGRRPPQRPMGGVTINLGGLGGFLGNGYGYLGGIPYAGGYTRRGYDLGEAIVDIGLGALLGTLSAASRANTTAQTTTPQSTFRGYRLVENVVPLGSPVYCIGEIYRHGNDVYMGASTSTEYSTSFFATRPEAEVISHLSK